MSRSVFLLAVLVVLLSCNDRPVDKTDPLTTAISAEAAKEDFDLFARMLKKAHPALGNNIADQRTNRLLDSVFKTIPDEDLSLRDLYNKMAFVADEMGCSHTNTNLPQNILDTIFYQNLFFPYPVSFVEGGLVINGGFDDLSPGTKIWSINNVPASDILGQLRMYNTVDGVHRETQQYMAASNFSLDYYKRYGAPREFELRVIDTMGKSKTIFADPVSLYDVSKRQEQLYYFDAMDVPYSLKINEEEHYAIFRLTRFDFDSHNQERAYEAFLENTFDLLRLRKDIRHLIIDLRENRGGDLFYCFLLHSYLSDKPFSEYNTVFSRIKAVPFKDALSTFDATDWLSINSRLYSEFTSHDTRGYLIPDSSIKIWEPNKKRFAGNVYVVTNANTASSATYFTSLVKNSGRGKVVGVETCGSEHAINGLSQLRYRLPASGIGVEFPYAKLVYSFRSDKADRGIIPDHIIPDTYESFKKNEDKQLKFIVDSLISKKR